MRIRLALALSVGALAVLALERWRAPSAAPPLAELPVEGGLAFDIRDGSSDARIPCKLTLIGTQGTPTPTLTKNDIGRQEGDSVVAWNRILSLTGFGVAHVPAGTYDITVSRGPEWTIETLPRVHVESRATASVRASLRHVVDSTGWISGDFHVHAASSSDSHVPMHDRVYEFIADGVEVIVSTDHNVVANYEPITPSSTTSASGPSSRA
jgi:hypothetical protein